MFYNYHGIIKSKIKNNELKYVEIVKTYNGISPAMVLYFKDLKVKVVREYRFKEYFELFEKMNFKNIVIKCEFKI